MKEQLTFQFGIIEHKLLIPLVKKEDILTDDEYDVIKHKEVYKSPVSGIVIEFGAIVIG